MARSLSERFDRQVDRSGDHHLWLGSTNPARGTGQLRVDGKLTTAHRVAWELAYDPLLPGTKVLPCPDVVTCVRVDHLSTSDAMGQVGGRPAGRRASKGSGSKREVRPGVWELSITAGRDAHGQVCRVFRTVRGSVTDASRALTALVAEVGDGRSVPSRAARGLTVNALVASYLDHLRDHKGRKHSTLVRYRGLTNKWVSPAIGERPAERLLPQDIEAVLGAMRSQGQSQSSIHQTFTLLNGTFKWARRNRLVTRNRLSMPRSLEAAPCPMRLHHPTSKGCARCSPKRWRTSPSSASCVISGP